MYARVVQSGAVRESPPPWAPSAGWSAWRTRSEFDLNKIPLILGSGPRDNKGVHPQWLDRIQCAAIQGEFAPLPGQPLCRPQTKTDQPREMVRNEPLKK